MPSKIRAAWIVCALLAGVQILLPADSPSGETWRFDRLDQVGGHPTTILGRPHLIETSLGRTVAHG